MWSKCIIFALLAIQAWARVTSPIQNSIQSQETPRSEEISSYLGDLRYVYTVYQECAAKDLAPCLKLKLLSAMDRVARNYPEISILDGVTVVQQANSNQNEVQTESEIEATLPRSLNERDTALNSMIADKIGNFFDTHTLQVKLPTASELQRSFNEESRGKKGKKNSGMLLLPLILGGTLIPLALGALALLAGKALIVSKLALVLAGIIGLKKLLSGGHSGGHESGHEVVVSGGHGSGWGRSYEKEQAQSKAYNAYAAQTR